MHACSSGAVRWSGPETGASMRLTEEEAALMVGYIGALGMLWRPPAAGLWGVDGGGEAGLTAGYALGVPGLLALPARA